MAGGSVDSGVAFLAGGTAAPGPSVVALAAEVVVSEADSEDSAAAAVAEGAEGRGGERSSKCEVQSAKVLRTKRREIATML